MTNATILDVMADETLFAPWFRGDSWRCWIACLKAIFCIPLDEAELAIFCAATGRTQPPATPVREAWLLVGRRGGKSVVAALVAVFLAVFRDYTPYRARGEVITIMLVSGDRKMARTLMRYVKALLQVPLLAALVIGETKESLTLSNGVVIEIHTNSKVSTRSYTLGACVNDEICFWPTSEGAAQADEEVLIAERPALSTVPGSLMLNISSGYARRGSMHAAFENHFGKDEDDVLFWRGPSRSLDPDAPVEMNPTIDRKIVALAYEADPSVAASEWGAEFRSDCERLFTEELLDRITDPDLPDPEFALPPNFEEEVVS